MVDLLSRREEFDVDSKRDKCGHAESSYKQSSNLFFFSMGSAIHD